MDCSTISINLENSERNSEGSNRSSPENLKKIPTSQHHTNNTSQMLATNLSLVSHQQLNPSNSVNSRHSLNLAAAAAAAAAAVSHLPHHPNLSLLNTLNVSGMFNHHTSPLDLMNVSHHHTNIGVQPPPPPRTYNSPPPISTNDPAANDCKLVDYRGQKVAAFIISGDTMLCLPQAFELFLKHLVGGLHTVYTKLKRLDIVPLVCNVEQVRILRGLGAIQPGVNRCKLLSCKDFDTLYRDCTTARPGRPPKRGPPINLNISPHLQLKKARLENGEYPYENGNLAENLGRLEKSPLLANGYNNPPHLNHISFLQMPHTTTTAHNSLMSPSMSHNTHPIRDSDNPLTTNYLKNQTIEALARSGIWENCRAAYEDIVKHLERLRDEKIDTERAALIDEKIRDLSNNNIHNNKIRDHDTDSLISSSPVLNLSKNCTVPVEDDRSQNSSESVLTKAEENRPKNNDDDIDDIDNDDGDYNDDVFSSNQLVNENVADDDDDDEDDDIEDSNQERNSEFNDEKDIDDEIDDKKFGSNEPNDDQQVINYANSSDREEEKRHENINRHQTDENEDEDDENALTLSLNSTLSSSTETLLRNIQGLLKLATENARHQEQKFHYEKGTNSHMTYLLSLAQYYLYLAATHNNF